jgi:putative DNA primase/helicase
MKKVKKRKELDESYNLKIVQDYIMLKDSAVNSIEVIDTPEITTEMASIIDQLKTIPTYEFSLFEEKNDVDKVLNGYLNNIRKVNFNLIALKNGILEPNEGHIMVIAIDELIRISRLHNWGLCFTEDKIFIYNSEYWINTTLEKIIHFLTKAIIKMGINHLNARQPSFQTSIFNQFKASANFEKPEYKVHTILINLKNGTYEIKDGIGFLRQFDRKDFLTYQLNFNYDESCETPLFSEYLNKVIPEDEKQKVLSEFLGYIFTRNGFLKLEKMLILYGTGANGKSVFFEIINAMLGKTNVSNLSLDSITKKEYHRAQLSEKLLNYGSEINGDLNLDVFKALASGEPVTARIPYGRVFHVENYGKFIFNCNELPKKTESSDGFYRRFLIIKFGVTIEKGEQDKQLHKKIINSELPGILNWALVGLSRLLANKSFSSDKLIELEIEEYKRNTDSVKAFLDEEKFTPDLSTTYTLSQIFEDYKKFCKDNNFMPLGNIKLKEELIKKGYFSKRSNSGVLIYMRKNVFLEGAISTPSSLNIEAKPNSDESDESDC